KVKYKTSKRSPMHHLSYPIITIIILSMGVTPVFAQTQSQFAVKDPSSAQSYPVNYSITKGTVNDMSINTGETSLIVSIQSTGDGNLTIALPRTLIDAKIGADDDQFYVLVDGADTDFGELKTDTDRTITVSFPDGTEEIEIIGTQVVPEFGSVAFAILAIAILFMIVFSAKTRIRIGQ